MNYWQRWTRAPQTTWLRRATFQVHLWSGIGVGLYVFLVSVTGSVLVYRNELYTATIRDPIVVAESGPRLTDDQLKAAAARAYPGYTVVSVNRPSNPDEAVAISLKNGTRVRTRLFNPYTGDDLADYVPLGFWLVSKLLELHDDLLAGRTGRRINGVLALLVLVLSVTGIVVWWPGVRKWRRSLTVRRHLGWQLFTWHLHSAVGFWSLGFILVFGISGAYLGNPEPFAYLADRLDPPNDATLGERTVDQVIYWLAYLHFGRINGIGIPCSGAGLCDKTTKFVWAFFGLAPAVMFVTGAVMWWNRVLRKKVRSSPQFVEGTMLSKTVVLAAVVAGLLGTSLLRLDAAGQAPESRADRLRRDTNNLALQNVAPFKVFDNLYYVGVGYVGSWLITTNQGLILIDTLEGAYKEHPLEGVRALGFDPRNIKYVILTHYHLDHTAGAARIQELPGVRLAMGEADWDALTRAPNPNNERLPRRDVAVKDGDTITVGSTTVKLHVLGGHTPATLGVDFTVYDAGKPYRAFMFGGAAPGPGRQAAEQFLASVNRIERMQDGVQARIVTHAWMDPEFWDRVDRLASRKPGDPHPFVAPDVFRAWIAELKTTAAARLDQEKAREAN